MGKVSLASLALAKNFSKIKMKTEQLSIYHKTYQMLKFFYAMVKNFPKEHKYSLGKEIVDLTWNCLDLTIEANNLRGKMKGDKIFELSLVFNKLKMRIRISQEINLISIGQFAHLQENYILIIGKEIGGWQKWAMNIR
ncbi:MAG: four helix bundle protein [Sphingobacteriia bacterium]|nr:four helix bundle protein [Sphingobacteriia bacterium]